ncbi:histidine protein methyltransferase 1 homolog [Diorhabda sublineata]|uniref:histidine protein methyltransferase 1 homolog n=1 Tax=Diorhabda sublineata TaxID=1163346 RepID=UPI0024E161BB|nr:histidine protein methyltransferase 1 homolog [Diorhabda sublineata]
MFKFNFNKDENNFEDVNIESLETIYAQSKEVLLEQSVNFVKFKLDKIETKVLKLTNLSIKYICSETLVSALKEIPNVTEDCILKAEHKHSDLIPAIYEGGLKIWECTYDLLDYFIHNRTDFKEKLVLDLGCGSGILGIFTLLNGSKSWFQDYNIEVLQNITVPNVLLNCEETEDSKFFSGDWDSFVTLVEERYPNEKFDYILTSETIYNKNYYAKLHLVFEKLLKKDGVVFLAAKSYYFGVGGGIHLFQDFLDEQKILKYRQCWQCNEGVKREILRLEFL